MYSILLFKHEWTFLCCIQDLQTVSLLVLLTSLQMHIITIFSFGIGGNAVTGLQK